jgi:hypothetical protein
MNDYIEVHIKKKLIAKENLMILSRSWQDRAQKHLSKAQNITSKEQKMILLQTAMLNINLATKLISIVQNIEEKTAQDIVLQEVIACDVERESMKNSLRNGVVIS